VDGTLFIGVMRVSLALPGARTLKDRRSVVVGLRDRLIARFKVACHEVTRTEMPGSAEVLVVTGGASAPVVREALDRIRSHVVGNPGYVVAGVRVQVLAWSGGEADGGRPEWEGGDV